MNEYDQLKRRLASGWNTWNTRSVLSHVWIGPEPDDAAGSDDGGRAGFALNLCLKSYQTGDYLEEALIGREDIRPGPHMADGRYTDLTLRWQGVHVRVESGRDGKDLVLLVTTSGNQKKPCPLVVEGGILWNRPGCVQRVGDALAGLLGDTTINVYATETPIDEPNVPTQTPYLALPLVEQLGISTGRRRSLNEIHAVIIARRAEWQRRRNTFGKLADVYEAIQSAVAWNTIYDPANDRVITPASRRRSVNQGGWALYCWETYFAALLASVDNKELAYANAIEMTREMVWEKTFDVGDVDPARQVGRSTRASTNVAAVPTPPTRTRGFDRLGFVPNVANATGFVSRDRSQPPVGSHVVLELFHRFGDRWFLDMLYDDLLAWNRWWASRRDCGGLLAWGSTPYEPRLDNQWEVNGVDSTDGAAFESGLDDSPMYDDVPFDSEKHVMKQVDAGLTALYIWDCDSLAQIAAILGRAEQQELAARADRYRSNYARLWSQADGIFYNLRIDTNEFSKRLSPTSYYALLAKVATPEQASSMVNKHFYNPSQFWGEWLMPSIARNDPAYADQDYWRGRIWAPMNFLVYLGLRNYDLPDARRALATKSEALLLKEWRSHRHVHENYSAETGDGCGVSNSDAFYHSGALLGLIALMEAEAGREASELKAGR